jgi:hypothetical protein
MLNFGMRAYWLEGNPAALIKKPGRERSRDRVLTDEEIRRLWRLLSRQPTTEERAAPGRKRAPGTVDDPICPVAPAMAAAIKMRLLTAQRGGEVIMASARLFARARNLRKELRCFSRWPWAGRAQLYSGRPERTWLGVFFE